MGTKLLFRAWNSYLSASFCSLGWRNDKSSDIDCMSALASEESGAVGNWDFELGVQKTTRSSLAPSSIG